MWILFSALWLRRCQSHGVADEGKKQFCHIGSDTWTGTVKHFIFLASKFGDF